MEASLPIFGAVARIFKSDGTKPSTSTAAVVAPLNPPSRQVTIEIHNIGPLHPRRDEFCSVIAQLSSYYAEHRDFILPQNYESLMKAANDGHLFVAVDPLDGSFVAAVQVKPLLMRDISGLSFDILEIGTLLKNPNTTHKHIGYSLVKACGDWALRNQALLIGTTRNEHTSGAAFVVGGFVIAPWQNSRALSALTCDPYCQSTDHGRAWVGCNGTVECHAMATHGNNRPDACKLYVSDARLAIELNDALMSGTPKIELEGYSALALRKKLGLLV